MLKWMWFNWVSVFIVLELSCVIRIIVGGNVE